MQENDQVITNLQGNTEHQNNLSVLINKDTYKYLYSNSTNDIIQSALEYNNYLITSIIKNKNNITQSEYDAAMDRLYDNLSVLSTHCEAYMKKHKLRKETQTEPQRSELTVETPIIKKTRNKTASALQNSKSFTNSFTGLTVKINQSLIKNNKLNIK